MSANKKSFEEKIQVIGHFLQRSVIVSLLMLLMVFGAAVFLLWMPSQSDLPELVENMQSPQDIEAVCDFTYQNRKEAQRNFQSFVLEFPLYFRLDPERTEKIMGGYDLLIQEILRRASDEDAGKTYGPPENADKETAELVNLVEKMPPQLFGFLRQIALDNTWKARAAAQVKEIVIGGIATEEEIQKAKPFSDNLSGGEGAQAVNAQKNAMILDEELREVGPVKLNELQTSRSAAEHTVKSLLSAIFYYDQQVPYEEEFQQLFLHLYENGNLAYDEEWTKKRLDEEYSEKPKEVREPEIYLKKGTVLIHKNDRITAEKAEMYKEYQIQYNNYLRELRTWPNLVQKTMLVALLIVFSCIFILRVHPELIANNRAIWLIGFIIIFSLLCNRLFMEYYNKIALDGGYPVVPLYLATPLALPALVIASIYSGRSAVFAGLFVAGVLAVALDFSFPAFVTGLFVCAVGTASVRRVYDLRKFIVVSFVACTITMILSSLIFQQNPDFLTIVLSHDWNRLGFSLAVPFTAGLLTTMVSAALILALETVLDVTSNTYYLSLTDRNHPLLKKLQMEAPGTYHHSERVALLAEEAANAVDAMSQKVQAYALFHDVGKLASPEMFTENAGGKDMFKGKSPAESAAIIRNHVEYGVQLARKYKLKTPLRRAIERHHGNDFISFFYEKEKELTGTTPPEEPFRYPGPLPEEIETVILMLADCCEAAVCSLDDPTEENIRALVEKIFNGKMQRKQLDAADVTLNQLSTIRESFLKTFKSMNHLRVSYSRREEARS